MSGILCSARLVKRFGTWKVIRTTMTCAVGGMVILSVALCASPLIFALITAFGATVLAPPKRRLMSKARRSNASEIKTVPADDVWFLQFSARWRAFGVGMALTALSVPANIHINPVAAVAISAHFLSPFGRSSTLQR